MRILLIIGWLFAGLGGAIYHFGPGQDRMELDRIGDALHEARQSAESCQWDRAIELFDQVLGEIPGDRQVEAYQVHLEKCKAQMMAARLPESRESLEQLLTDARADEHADPRFVAEVESTLANSQYYMTWLMRLEGLPDTEWMPEIDEARQHYTQLLAEAESIGDEELTRRFAEDLESSIRLARMDLSELQGLPLPSQ